jgi:hypothetical protein
MSLPDMHFGKMALQDETGEEWNLEIAENVYKAACNALLESASECKPEQILFPVGNDLLNIDNDWGTTTAGTQQDNTHSLAQLFKRVKIIIRDTILMLREVSPVHVLCVPGNHDRTMSYLLVDALEDSFLHDKHVTVDNLPTPRKYVQWGISLIGFTHGDQEKHQSLPGIMANERPELWANTKWREWHIGHTHRKKQFHFLPTVTHNGVIVRSIPSLTAADRWHFRKGYVGGVRSAEAFIWNKENALTATYGANLI